MRQAAPDPRHCAQLPRRGFLAGEACSLRCAALLMACPPASLPAPQQEPPATAPVAAHCTQPAQIESDEDVLWQLEHRETHDEIKRRGVRFMHVSVGPAGGSGRQRWVAGGLPQGSRSACSRAPACCMWPALPAWPPAARLQWLMQRPERSLAVIAHGGFLFHGLGCFGANLAGPSMLELHRWQAGPSSFLFFLLLPPGKQHLTRPPAAARPAPRPPPRLP